MSVMPQNVYSCFFFRNNLHARHTPSDHDNKVLTKVFVWRLQDGMYGTGLLLYVPIRPCLCMYLTYSLKHWVRCFQTMTQSFIIHVHCSSRHLDIRVYKFHDRTCIMEK